MREKITCQFCADSVKPYGLKRSPAGWNAAKESASQLMNLLKDTYPSNIDERETQATGEETAQNRGYVQAANIPN